MATVRHKLEVIQQEDVAVIGICSHEHDHRLCWSLNRTLGLSMGRRAVDIIALEHPFIAFDWCEEDTNEGCSLIGNRSGGAVLIKEQKHVDHFLVLHGEENVERAEHTLAIVRDTELVLTAFAVDAQQMKNGNLLLKRT